MENNENSGLIVSPENSLMVDPNNVFNMSTEQKMFIEYYIQFKNLSVAAEFAGIELEEAKRYFVDYNTQYEIRRIHSEICKRQFSSDILSIDDIGGYLSSLIKEDNVPIGEQLNTKDKLKVASLLIDLNKFKEESGEENKPETVINNLNIELKNLSIETIKKLLEQSGDNPLSKEEIDLLSGLTTKEVIEVMENIDNKEDKDE